MFNETQNIKNPFLSIVMPVYRVEDVLTAAVEDVLNQTFTDFALILVDDCSPDGSGALCDELAKKDSLAVVKTSLNFLAWNNGDDYVLQLHLLHSLAVGLCGGSGSRVRSE